jgi:hypothetical protein
MTAQIFVICELPPKGTCPGFPRQPASGLRKAPANRAVKPAKTCKLGGCEGSNTTWPRRNLRRETASKK